MEAFTKTIMIAICFFLMSIAASLIVINKTLERFQKVQERDNMEYQLMLENDSIIIWDNNRYVGSIPYDNSKIDSLLRKDNE